MPHTVIWLDRLRVERLVWSLDQQLYDLPRRTRITTRREVRANLLAAAQDIGATEALRRIGGSRQLAEEYLQAELGSGPRHSWMAAAYVLALGPLLLNFFLGEADSAFRSAVTSADPHISGTFVWHGVSYLQSAVTYTFDHGAVSSTGGAWTPLTYALCLLAAITAGRLWRLLPTFRRPRPTPLGA